MAGIPKAVLQRAKEKSDTFAAELDQLTRRVQRKDD
jgi:hypothetical protein